ncbi:MAG: D-alanine--D-alanine ligase family protein [Bacteroidota bacterium]
MKNIALICGGQSPEHEISIRSAKNILGHLDRAKYTVHLIGISKSGKWFSMDESALEDVIPEVGDQLKIVPGTADCFVTDKGALGKMAAIFPILHGPNGEDGAVQGLMQLLNLPFVGPGVLGASMSMDKDVAKKMLRYEGLKVADWVTVRKGEDVPTYAQLCGQLGEVLFVKPANMGSSVGVSRVSDETSWNAAIKEAFVYDDKVLVEVRLIGREIECAVKGNEHVTASGVGEVVSGDVYSYEQKYASGSSAKTVIPADVSETELKTLQSHAICAYKALECKGLSRVDSFLTASGDVYINEVNTMPGFTSISMYPSLWEQEGVSYTALLDELIELAIARGGIDQGLA